MRHAYRFLMVVLLVTWGLIISVLLELVHSTYTSTLLYLLFLFTIYYFYYFISLNIYYPYIQNNWVYVQIRDLLRAGTYLAGSRWAELDCVQTATDEGQLCMGLVGVAKKTAPKTLARRWQWCAFSAASNFFLLSWDFLYPCYIFILPTHHICRISVRKEVQVSLLVMLWGVASFACCGTNYPSVF